MEELQEWYWSDDLSLTSLQEKISKLSISADDFTQETYNKYPLLHYVCINEKVTLEMVEYIIDKFPSMVSLKTDAFDFDGESDEWEEEEPYVKTTSYALHCACYNQCCPSAVIKLLLEEFRSAAKWLSLVEDGINTYYCVKGLPFHYYLSRNKNVDFDIMKLLVEAYPQSLMVTGEEVACYPIHAFLLNSESTNNMHTIVERLLELDPASLRVLDGDGRTPLDLACRNRMVSYEAVKLLFNSWTDSIRMRDLEEDLLPIHQLCCNHALDDAPALEILRFMIDADQTVTRDRNEQGYLPIHYAIHNMSFEFCKVLIDTYPESIKVGTGDGNLPIHVACSSFSYGTYGTSIEMIQYLLDIYPESINVRNGEGHLLIHRAAQGKRVDIVELLLKYNPDAASKETSSNRRLPLHVVCDTYAGNVDVVKTLYDAFPQAITIRDGDGKSPSTLSKRRKHRKSNPIKTFIQAQLAYARKARDTSAMTTPDENGWLPLHHALKNKAPLGTIKLLAKGAPLTVRTADNQFAFPLHIACAFSSAKVVKYLVELDINGCILEHYDTNKDSILHYACRGGNLEVIKYLLTNHTSLASAEVNKKGELPIHLLCEAGKDDGDGDDVDSDRAAEHVETIWLMLLADPEAVMS